MDLKKQQAYEDGSTFEENSQPLVSVLIPYYNDKTYLRTAIEAVLNNNYKNFELILLNHATTDECRDIAHSYNDERIKHIDMPYNLGFGGSGLLVQEFLKLASGKYVKFLCADDELLPNGLVDLVEYMENNPQIDFAFGDVEYVNEKGKDLQVSWFENRPHFSINNNEADCIRLYYECRSFLPWIGSIVKSNVLRQIEINTTFLMLFDMSVWLTLLCKGFKIGYLVNKVANYRISDNQLSSNSKKEQSVLFTRHELPPFADIFLTIKDIDLVKEIWPNSEYVKILSRVEDIPFVVSVELLKYQTIGYYHITQMLNDPEKREYLQKTFNYGVRELRKDVFSHIKVRSFKHHCFST